jgi:hypothetical protein
MLWSLSYPHKTESAIDVAMCLRSASSMANYIKLVLQLLPSRNTGLMLTYMRSRIHLIPCSLLLYLTEKPYLRKPVSTARRIVHGNQETLTLSNMCSHLQLPELDSGSVLSLWPCPKRPPIDCALTSRLASLKRNSIRAPLQQKFD